MTTSAPTGCPSCGLCHRPIAGPRLTDPAAGLEFHPACVAQRAPQDALVALTAVLALTLAPLVLAWAS